MPAKVRLTGRLICASEADAAIVRQYLPLHLALTRAEPGFLSFDVTETDDALICTVEELFIDRSAFDAHQARTKASEWARQTASIRREYRVNDV